jgi:fluoroquinolone transport system permease protein
MKTLALFRALGPVDLKNVRRDSLLVWVLALPLVMALVIRVLVPEISALVQTHFAFDLAPYYPLIMSAFMLLTPTTIGMIAGFLLLDERDDQVLSALLVTPVSLTGFVLYRLSAPVILSVVMTLIGYSIAGLTAISLLDLLLVALLGAFNGPLVALFLVGFAENKVAGFAMLKLLNGLLMLPIAAFFVEEPWQAFAGIIPAYWALKVFWLAAAGQSYGWFFAIGLAVNLAFLALLLRRFAAFVRRK